MQHAPIPENERERLEALRRLKVLDTTNEVIFDSITEIASSICESPIALISLIDDKRQWFKSRFGLEAKETPREVSFCGHAIHQNKIFEIPDAHLDERFADNPLVTGGPIVRFYAGAPLITSSGHAIGTLCVIDHEPKSLTNKQKKSLDILAKQVIALFELKLSREEILEREERLNSLTENMSEGMVLHDHTGKIVEFNSSALNHLGLTQDQITGKTSLDPSWKTIKESGSPFPGNEHPAMVCLETGKPLKNNIMGVHRPNGEICWININATPIFTTDDKPNQALVTFSDITEEKKLKEELRKRELKLIQSSKMSALGEMAAGMAHEINNPLAIISAYSGVMKSQLMEKKESFDIFGFIEKFTQIENTIHRIASIITGLRQFSRNADQDPKISISIRKIIDDTLMFCEERFKNNKIELRVMVSEDTEFKARPTQIIQVLLNLLNNAFDAVLETKDPWIEVTVSKNQNALNISVSDSGIKIPKNIQEKMMLPFFTTKEVGKGTGLGLSISQGLVESHGGKLYYDETSPHNRFTIEIPNDQ